MSKPGETIDGHASCAPNLENLPTLTLIARAALLLSAEGASLGLLFAYQHLREDPFQFLTTNNITRELRQGLLLRVLAGAVLWVLVALAFAGINRTRLRFTHSLLLFSRRCAPLGVVGFIPYLYQWQYWTGHQLPFLALTGIALLCLSAGLKTAVDAGIFPWEQSYFSDLNCALRGAARAWPNGARWLPLGIVGLGSLLYTIHFAYYTIAFHQGVYSSYDLAIENNVMWNVLHNNEFFKSTIIFGPVGSHFGYHATLFAYAMLPIYALSPRPETLLMIQAGLLGFAAVPLYLFARRHIHETLACIIALLYLFYPAVHGANMYEFHYPPLGTFFLWTLIYAMDARRNILTVVALILTLSVREDVSAGPMIWGAYFLISGRRPKTGIAVAVASATYFALIKLVIMPHFAGQETFAFIFKDLIPPGDKGFLSIIKTLITNPAYTMTKVYEPEKLLFLLQIFTPLAFLPLRRAMGALFLAPGIFFCLLSTDYGAVVSIHYQYTAHWTTYLFVALVLVLASSTPRHRWARVGTMAFAIFVCSYQFGAILQKNNCWGGPIPYKFGRTPEAVTRHAAMQEILTFIPDESKVSASVFVTPQISSRQYAYQLTVGVFDAEYLVFPSVRRDFSPGEQTLLTNLFRSGTFGVVAIRPPFAVAKRSHATDLNAQLLSRW
jgi:uncharacterized membrane protein